MPPKYLTLAQASAARGISRKTLESMIRNKQVAAETIAGRLVIRESRLGAIPVRKRGRQAGSKLQKLI